VEFSTIRPYGPGPEFMAPLEPARA
jgi:hypothetical protein